MVLDFNVHCCFPNQKNSQMLWISKLTCPQKSAQMLYNTTLLSTGAISWYCACNCQKLLQKPNFCCMNLVVSPPLRPFKADWAGSWAKCIFCTHNLKNSWNGLFWSCLCMGDWHVLPKTFHPNDFIFTLRAKPITFRPRPPRRICLGGTFVPHFHSSPPLLKLYSISAPICHVVMSNTSYYSWD